MWEVKKPDKDGIWLWKLPSRKHYGKGVILVHDGKVDDLSTSPVVTFDLDVWWGIYPVETFYVEGA